MSKSNFTIHFDATAMFNLFRTKCSVENKEDEFVLFTRIGRGTKRFTINNIFWGMLKYDSNFDVGDIVDDHKGNLYFLVAKVNSYRADKAELYKTNCKVKIVRLEDQYEGNDIIGQTESVIADNLLAVYEEVSARMKMYDVGLLESTTVRVLIPKTVDVKVLDRLYLNSEAYLVNNVNTSSFPGCYYLQLGADTRGN